MAKQLSHYVCQECGAEFPKWQGQCNQCSKWNTLVETAVASEKISSFAKKGVSGQVVDVFTLNSVKSKTFSRDKTDISELDRVLGGGIVPGSLVFIAGEPGIGKSTLLTQLALKISLRKENNKILYICGEESPEQIKLRIQRFNPSSKNSSYKSNFHFLAETNLENILKTIEKEGKDFSLIIVDSIQTIWTQVLTGAAGSVGQVRQTSNILLSLAKKTNIPVFLIGHITKEGAIAGPKVLEHLVDTVLYLEGETEHDFRLLRTTKNRFGATDEVGIFKMTGKGMEEVKNPGSIFLETEKGKIEGNGRAITVSLQGVRPILVEIQALVVPTKIVIPRRVASGIDYKRLQVICAILQKRLNIPLYSSDVFLNVAGGLKLKEPASDLAVIMAILSSFKNKALIKKAVCLGEVGLLGEIRKVGFMEKRIKEAQKLGYTTIIGQSEKQIFQTLKYLK
ncbi:DNA repair protein RadA [Candidatus Beckwithbacteria bacterium CG10_big_fil_rev_8_21_14_0_10_34_10]|uniref:DNA repair protein RadA n=1 Tax=Candidatus Beckwithbacteria bacterium CG10_big_fil_rev_8_21_14_0_10_34_10 TaxID=1974495 RepID=A0A2H0W7V2_9BACT|nr:MAG: DNA repair protein RadA [Candidatus Beckwithbacteria bacterium CG10_big_fil_rev_8_21_14_0_10_34_10]